MGVIDTDIQSPGIHILFGLAGEQISASLNDYLWHDRDIKDTALDMTPSLNGPTSGKLFLIPSSVKPGEITRLLREGYDAQRLTQGLRRLVDELGLDVPDRHPPRPERGDAAFQLSS
jgi:septum site-determining protein MinD